MTTARTRQSLRCAGCKQRIVGRSLTAQGLAWHPEHFVCARCGLPIDAAKYRDEDGRAFHLRCAAQRAGVRCELCGNELAGEYLVDHWNTKFCREHLSDYPRCRFCQRLVPPQVARGHAVEDVRCSICESTGVLDMRSAQPLFQAVVRWIGSMGLRFNNLDLRVDLCDPQALLRYQQQVQHGATLGVTVRTFRGSGSSRNYAGVDRVLVLQRLPPALFQGVSAHELGHAWLTVHNVQQLDALQEEGFCELLAHRFYRDQASPEATYYAKCIEQNPDTTYGRGFRDVLSLANRHGFARLVRSLEIEKQMPR